MGHSPVPEQSGGVRLDRRAALKRGAIVGGALVWAAPVVQAVSLTAAHAESPSSPPHNNPPPTGGGQPPPASPPAGGHNPGPPASPPASPVASPSSVASPSGSGGELAFTGPGLPVVPTLAVGATLIATGAAAQAVGRRHDPDLDDIEEEPA